MTITGAEVGSQGAALHPYFGYHSAIDIRKAGAIILKLLKGISALIMVLVLVQQFVMGGCANSNATYRGTFKIGLIAPFSGPSSDIGYNMLFGAKLAIKEWNESNHLNGYRVELVAQDDRDEAVSGLTQAKKMILDGDIVGVVGHPSNASALAAAEAYSKAGLPMITTEATSDELMDGKYPGIFRLSASDSVVLSETVKFVATTLKTQKLAIVAEPITDSIKYSERFYELTKASGLSLSFGEPLKPEQTDFYDISRRMAASAPQAIFFKGDYLNAGALVKQIRSQKMNGIFLANMGAANPLFVKVAGDGAEGAYVVSLAPNPTDIPTATNFVQAYRALSGLDPLPSAVLTYDATNLILSAVERGLKEQPAPSRAVVLTGLRDTQDYTGLSSTISFDETGGIVDPKVYFYRIAGLRFPGEKQ